MRKFDTKVQHLKYKVLREVARLAWNDTLLENIMDIPAKLAPGKEATDINFYVGRAVNPAHQNPDLPINFNIKMNLVEELSACLRKMGKRIKVSYF